MAETLRPTAEQNTKPMVIPVTDTSPQPIRFFEPLPRVRKAIHFALDNPQNKKKFQGTIPPIPSEKQFETIEDVEGLAQKNESQLLLTDLHPSTGVEDTLERFTRVDFIPTEDPAYQRVVQLAMEKPKVFWVTPEGRKALAELDKAIYARVEQQYQVDNGRMYFDNAMKAVKRQINGLIERRLKEYKSTVNPRNEQVFAAGPAKLILMALSSTSTDTLQTESIQRLVLNQVYSKAELKARGVGAVVSDIQDYLDIEVFNGGQLVGEAIEHEIFGVFDNKTNAPLWLSSSGQRLTAELYASLAAEAHVKRLTYAMRDAGKEVGPVLTDPRDKEDERTIEKTIRDADTRSELVGDNRLEPKDIHDLVGMIFISKNGKAALLRDIVNQRVLINRMGFEPRHLLNRDKNGNQEIEDGKSPEVRYYRTQATLPEHLRAETHDQAPIEFIYMNLEDEIRYRYEVGESDPGTGMYKGQAHDLFAAKRDEKVIRHEFKHKKNIPLEKIIWRANINTAKDLRKAHRVKQNQLPKKFRPESQLREKVIG